MRYDELRPLPRRPWGLRPHDRRWSQFILGRRRNLSAAMKGSFKVSCYLTMDGRYFFTDPVYSKVSKSSRVLYRIRIKPK